MSVAHRVFSTFKTSENEGLIRENMEAKEFAIVMGLIFALVGLVVSIVGLFTSVSIFSYGLFAVGIGVIFCVLGFKVPYGWVIIVIVWFVIIFLVLGAYGIKGIPTLIKIGGSGNITVGGS